MKTITPQYYNDFKCIAGDCRHSCCVGWEIDIDTETYEKYKKDKSDFGRKIFENIDVGEAGVCFRLDEDEKCPFLNDKGLCDIIIQKGENALCNICTDHPRFRNFFSSHTEMGLGMCCEEAVRIILGCLKPFTQMFPLDYADDAREEEKNFFQKRIMAFKILCDRNQSIGLRIKSLLEQFGIEDCFSDMKSVSEELTEYEILDPKWKKCIDMLSECENSDDNFLGNNFWETVFEQLISYFLFRHLPDSIDDGRFNERVAFSVLGYKIIKTLCNSHRSRYGKIAFEDVCEYCRMFSSEIEYSDENTEALIDYITFC